jgi:hypothetical protein
MVNIHHARTQQAGRKAVPFSQGRSARKLGLLRGKIRVAKSFDAPLPDDIMARFES